MKELKINYRQNWDCEGTHTTQNITLSKEIFEKFNFYLEELNNSILEQRIIESKDVEILMYATPIWNYKRCIGITRLRLLKVFLKDKGYDTTRLLTDRNTMIIEE